MAAADAILSPIRLAYARLDGLVSAKVFGALENWASVTLSPVATPPTRGLPLIDSPTPMVLLVSAYLATVFLGLLRIKVFDLKPLEKEHWTLKSYVILHNTFCFLLSLYMAVGIALEAVKNRFSIWGNAYYENQTQMAWYLYVFYMSKYIEFGDTIIMLIKRSTRQVSVLHVYHHSSIAVIWWVICYHAPGGEAYFSAALNSLVHVFMYFYYLLSALVGKDEKAKRKYLFWGRYLTQFQMFQFVLNMFQGLYDVVYKVPYPTWLSAFLFYYMISLLALFSNFYVRKYLVSKSKPVPRPKKRN